MLKYKIPVHLKQETKRCIHSDSKSILKQRYIRHLVEIDHFQCPYITERDKTLISTPVFCKCRKPFIHNPTKTALVRNKQSD
jgi:hypothetical protein